MANTRTGRARGYRNQKGGAHTLPWHEDPIILDRIEFGRVPWLQKKSEAECLAIVNQKLAEAFPDEPPISRETLYLDRKRAIELRQQRTVSQIDEHLEEYDYLKSKAHKLLAEQKSNSQNVTGLVNGIASIIEKQSKLDGSHIERQSIAVGVVDGDTNPLAELTPSEFGQACGVLYQQSEEFRKAFDAQVGTTVRVVETVAISAPKPGENHTNGHKEPPEDGVVPYVP